MEYDDDDVNKISLFEAASEVSMKVDDTWPQKPTESFYVHGKTEKPRLPAHFGEWTTSADHNLKISPQIFVIDWLIIDWE
jgi:hypothetical protein